MIKEKIKAHFNKANKSYDEHCQLQQYVGNKLITLLKPFSPPYANIIDIGCGTGITTQHLAKQLSYQAFHAIDIATQLLSVANERLLPLGIHTYEGDMDKLFSPPPYFDIIFSNMALHWSMNLAETINKIAALANMQGILAFSLPLPRTLLELQRAFSLNNFIDASKIENYLRDNSYEILIQQTEKITLSFDNTRAALASIKKVGANYVQHRTRIGLRGKSVMHQINLSKITYVIGYFIARKRDTI